MYIIYTNIEYVNNDNINEFMIKSKNMFNYSSTTQI